MELSKNGKLENVIVTDLARLSRDSLQIRQLLEKFFPEYGVQLYLLDGSFEVESIQLNVFGFSKK